MITVIIVNDKSHNDLDRTLRSLEKQSYKDFQIIICNPYNEDVDCDYMVMPTPLGINNQINTAVHHSDTQFFAVTNSGCVANKNWLKYIVLNLSVGIDIVTGSVDIYSKSYQPVWYTKPRSYKLGEADCYNNAYYANFAFSLKLYKEKVGFNAEHDDQEFFKYDPLHNFLPHNYVKKIVDTGLPYKNDYYKFKTTEKPKFAQWKDVVEEKFTKTKPNLVITVAVGDTFKEILDFSEGQIFKYAKKLDADYIQLTNITQDWWGLEKFRIKNFASQYDRVLAIDADLWLRDEIPNIFDEVPYGHIGVFNDFADNYDGTRDGNDSILLEAKEMCFYQNSDYIESEMYNSGVVVFNGSQADIWEPPKEPFVPKHCSEQHWFEQNIRRNKYKVYELDRKWNNQYWTDCYEREKNNSYILHAAGHKNKCYFISQLRSETLSIKDNQIINIEYKKIDIRKHSDYCVVCVCSDNNKLFKYTKKSHQKYAQKVGADYHVVSENLNAHWPMGNKYLIYNFTSKYKKTLYVDSDVYIKENSPNVFNITPDDKISIYNERYDIEHRSFNKYVQTTQDIITNHFGLQTIPSVSLNCGVMVIPQSCAYLYKKPEKPIPVFWSFDQHYLWINMYLNKTNYYNLSAIFNWEHIRQNWEKGLGDAFFIHLNGIKVEDKRLRMLKKVLQYGN